MGVYINQGGFWLPMRDGGVPTLPAGMYEVIQSMMGNGFRPMKIQTDNLDLLEDSAAVSILASIREFWARREEYASVGLLHKRGFLLHGKPGTGKTSVVNLVAKELIADGGLVLVVESPGEARWALPTVRGIEPERPLLVVLEDIDRMAHAELLPILDGQLSVGNVVFIATTNYIKRMPPRITQRPGRFDAVFAVDEVSEVTRRDYFQRKLGDVTTEEMDRWVQAGRGLPLSALKELVVGVKLFNRPLTQEGQRLREWLREEGN